jgi:adenylylsulfate kinase-like enzyme
MSNFIDDFSNTSKSREYCSGSGVKHKVNNSSNISGVNSQTNGIKDEDDEHSRASKLINLNFIDKNNNNTQFNLEINKPTSDTYFCSTMIKATNIAYQNSKIDRQERLNTFKSRAQNGCTIWFTGLACSGKTSISFALEEYLTKKRQISTYCLDGDNIRHGLNSNLGFSPTERTENIRRIGEVSKLFADSGVVCLVAFISPYRIVIYSTICYLIKQYFNEKFLDFFFLKCFLG